MMKPCSIALMLACLAAGPALARDHVPEQAPVPPADQALGVVVTPEPAVAEVHAPRLRDSLRQPVSVQPAGSARYRMAEDERRKMREWLRDQAQETHLK